jgi:ATP-dependent DNA helicase RecG
MPDYSKTDLFQVELSIIGEVEDKAFAAFVTHAQDQRDKNDQLGTFDILALHSIKEGKSEGIDGAILNKLEESDLIKRTGGSASDKYVLADLYFELQNGSAEIAGFRTIDLERILMTFDGGVESVKMKDFVTTFTGDLTRDQVKYLVERLLGLVLDKNGTGSGTSYSLVTGIENMNDVKRILENG